MQFVLHDGTFFARLILQKETWLALGWQHDGRMVGGRAVIGLPGQSDVSQNEYELTAENLAGLQSLEAGTSLVSSSVEQPGDGTTILTLARLVNNADDSTFNLMTDGSIYTTFIWAYGFDNQLGFHEEQGSFRLKLEECVTPENNDNTVAGIEQSSSSSGGGSQFDSRQTRTMWIAHGFLGLIAWAVLAPVAVSASWLRALLPKGWWFPLHVYTNVMVFLMTTTAFVMAVLLVQDQDKEHFSGSIHTTVGLIVGMVVTIQAIAGFLRPAASTSRVDVLESRSVDPSVESSVESLVATNQTSTDGPSQATSEPRPTQRRRSKKAPRRDSASSSLSSAASSGKNYVRTTWEIVHKIMGLLLITLGLWQTKSGMTLYAEKYNSTDYSAYLWIYVGAFLSIVILLSAYVRIKHLV